MASLGKKSRLSRDSSPTWTLDTRPEAEPGQLGDSPKPIAQPFLPASPLPAPVSLPQTADLQCAPNTFSASGGLWPPRLGFHLSAISSPAPASAPARGGGSARQLSLAPLRKLGAKPPPWGAQSSLVPGSIPTTPERAWGGVRKAGETFSARGGGGSGNRLLTAGSAPGAILVLSQPRRLGASERARSLPPLPPSAAPSPGPGLASSLPPRRRALALYNSTRARPGLCKGWRRPAANGVAARAGGPGLGAPARPIAAWGARGAGWGKGRLPALI